MYYLKGPNIFFFCITLELVFSGLISIDSVTAEIKIHENESFIVCTFVQFLLLHFDPLSCNCKSLLFINDCSVMKALWNYIKITNWTHFTPSRTSILCVFSSLTQHSAPQHFHFFLSAGSYSAVSDTLCLNKICISPSVMKWIIYGEWWTNKWVSVIHALIAPVNKCR